MFCRKLSFQQDESDCTKYNDQSQDEGKKANSNFQARDHNGHYVCSVPERRAAFRGGLVVGVVDAKDFEFVGVDASCHVVVYVH